jgi:hypothetical protein
MAAVMPLDNLSRLVSVSLVFKRYQLKTSKSFRASSYTRLSLHNQPQHGALLNLTKFQTQNSPSKSLVSSLSLFRY